MRIRTFITRDNAARFHPLGYAMLTQMVKPWFLARSSKELPIGRSLKEDLFQIFRPRPCLSSTNWQRSPSTVLKRKTQRKKSSGELPNDE
jgi:hypothetical protein